MRLVIEDAAGTRSVLPFASDEITLGRAREGNTFRLEERTVSRRHARLLRAGGAVFIEDLGSLTGTRVNGERITARRRLRDGDLIEIGGYDLALLPEEDRPGAPPALRPTPAPFTPAPAVPAATAAPPVAAAGVAPAPAPADVAAGPGREAVASTTSAQPGTPPPDPAPTSAAPPAAPPAAAIPAAPSPAAVPAAPPPAAVPVSAPVPAAGAALVPAPAPLAGASSPPAPAAIPAAPSTSPARPGALGRVLVAGALALVLGFGAGWAVGVLTAPPPSAAGEAAAAR